MIFDKNYLWNENRVFNSMWTVIFFHVIFNFSREKIKNSTVQLKQISSLNQWRLLWWQWFCITRRWCQASTSKQTIQKLENGKFLTKVRKTDRMAEFIVLEMWNGHFIFYTWSIIPLPLYYPLISWSPELGWLTLDQCCF